MARAWKTCSCVGCASHDKGCPEVVPQGTSRCDDCEHTADRARGTATARGYNSPAYRASKPVVLRRDPICTVCGTAPSTIPDHWPTSRRDLVAQDVRNPDHPSRMRGVCAPCHRSETAKNQPGGWNAR